MDQLLKQFATNGVLDGMDIGYRDFFLIVGLSFTLASVIAIVYRYTHSGLSYSRSFAMTMILMSLTIAFIMMIIGSNLARAFSLVGALSIIRYRNAVKESRDTAYIFLSMAIGMACGVRLYPFAILFTGITSVLVLVFEKFNFAGSTSQERLLQVSVPVAFKETGKLEKMISDVTQGKYYLLSSEQIGGERVTTYSLELSRKKISGDILGQFSQIHPDAQFKIMAGFENFNV
jgi:uncharacterized membrane protein YhiD involved in acid resistance